MDSNKNICLLCQKQTSETLVPLNATDNPGISIFDKFTSITLNCFDHIDPVAGQICINCCRSITYCYKFITKIKKIHSRPSENINVPLSPNENLVKDDKLFIEESEKETLQCDLCFKNFTKLWELRKHKKRIHADDELRHQCNYCDKVFKHSFHLTEHLRVHLGVKPHECQYCGSKFHKLYSKKRHERTHLVDVGKKKCKKDPFLCSICGKEFPYKNNLTRHLRSHYDFKMHECKVCLKRFTQSSHVVMHLKRNCKGSISNVTNG